MLPDHWWPSPLVKQGISCYSLMPTRIIQQFIQLRTSPMLFIAFANSSLKWKISKTAKSKGFVEMGEESI